MSGDLSVHRVSRGTGSLWERFWCRVLGGHRRGEFMPEWFPGGPGFICPRCGGVYQWVNGSEDYDEHGRERVPARIYDADGEEVRRA